MISHSVTIFHDLPGLIGAEKPPRIGGFVPDVYAINSPLSIAVIGEAKTEEDLDSEHSRKQLGAFLGFLAMQPNSALVVAVPWAATATAKNLTRRLVAANHSDNVNVIVLDDATMVSQC